MKNTSDYSSRFRILKGGKISLVVSALLVGSSLMGATTTVHSDVRTDATINVGDINDHTSHMTGSITNTSNSYYSAFVAGTIDYFSTFWNAGTIDVNVSTANVASGMKFTSLANGGDTTTQSTVKNSGTIEITNNAMGVPGTFYAAGITGGDATDSNVTNSGSITVSTGNVTGAGAQFSGDAVGINIGNLNNADIINTGIITVTSGDANSTDDMGAASGIAIGIQALDLNGGSLIQNSGTITATSTSEIARGILIYGRSYGNASISNSGTITVITSTDNQARGISASGGLFDNAAISNSGTINATSTEDQARGISTSHLYNDASISNSGTINATSTNGEVRGIRTSRLNDNASISNSGTINATSTNNYAYGIITNRIETNAFVLNNHIINATSTNFVAKGIYIDGDLYGSVENNGTISVTAGSIATGIYVDAMYADNIDSTITNTANGSISVTSTGGNARGIFAYGENDDGIITNAGTITAAISSGVSYTAFGIYSDGHINHIENSGTITAKSDFISYGIFENGTNYNAAINSGTISGLDTDGELFAHGFSFKGVSLDNTSTGKMYGNINASGTISNAGLISLPHQAGEDDIHPAASINTFVNAATGTLEIGLLTDGTLEGSTYSKLETTNATFEDGSTIRVNILEASTGVGLLVGETLENVVSASTSLTINGTLNVTDTSNLIDFEYFLTNGEDANISTTDGTAGNINLNIIAQNGATFESTTSAGGGNASTQAASSALDTINASLANYSAMAPIISLLNTESFKGDAALAKAVESTTPVASTGAAGASSQISNGVQGIVEMRQRANVGGKNSGDDVFAEKNLWIKPFGSLGSQDDKDGMNGFEVKAAGVGFGFDGEYATNQKVGLALFYTKANVDVNNMSQTSDLGVFSTLVYGNIPILDDKTNFLYQLGYAWQNTDTDRYIALTQETASAEYRTNTASLDLKVIRDIPVTDRFLVQPIVETTYRNFTSPDYTETGAGALNLNSYKFSSDELIVGGGVLAHYKLDKDSKIIGNVNAGYDLYDKEQTITTSYSGASEIKFGTNGIDNGRWNYDLGIGYERDVTTGNSINFMYNYQGQGTTFENHVLSAKYVLTF